eukprot:TRINITY_DN999_c0_g1_i11.p2 TRINITY_DN999_c0_g1~~TRINITY_DN999_c0_g1_i11.p2  ORF type:complete len:376 (+),score=78.07 TRINITY_DN999_c0_g1_i11:2163-3290(+)
MLVELAPHVDFASAEGAEELLAAAKSAQKQTAGDEPCTASTPPTRAPLLSDTRASHRVEMVLHTGERLPAVLLWTARELRRPHPASVTELATLLAETGSKELEACYKDISCVYGPMKTLVDNVANNQRGAWNAYEVYEIVARTIRELKKVGRREDAAGELGKQMSKLLEERWGAADSGALTWKCVRQLHPRRMVAMSYSGTNMSREDFNLQLRTTVTEEAWKHYFERAERYAGVDGAEVSLPEFWAKAYWDGRGGGCAYLGRLARGWLNMPASATQPDSFSSTVAGINPGCTETTAIRKSFLIANQDLAGKINSTRVRRGFPGSAGDFNVPVPKPKAEAISDDDGEGISANEPPIDSVEDALKVLVQHVANAPTA